MNDPEDPTNRYRITCRGTGIELRGYIDGADKVREFAGALAMGMEPTDPMLVVTPVADDWTPFGPSAPERVVTLPGDDPNASSRVLYPLADPRAWGFHGEEGDG